MFIDKLKIRLYRVQHMGERGIGDLNSKVLSRQSTRSSKQVPHTQKKQCAWNEIWIQDSQFSLCWWQVLTFHD